MADRLNGRTVAITGAGSGQGRAGAILFAREGANLALCDINGDGLRETVELVGEESPKTDVLALPTNLTDGAELDAFVAATVARFGVVDALYNNAGRIHFGSFEDATPELWDQLHDINVKAPFFLIQKFLPALRKSSSASIINISSGAGILAPSPGMAVYCSSKGAMVAVTRGLAQDLAADHIRVNCIVPGFIDTPMSRGYYEQVPEDERDAARTEAASRALHKRPGTAEEVAAVAVFLATQDASYINGAIIPVDDGFSAS